ncbi:MAG TPA: alpha/beta fold hydrolase [Thermoleophilaceae bacterium]|jgi:pimeloyl-ACP methyl ester carboxylesterase
MASTPEYLQQLIDRFDPEPFDSPSGDARVRLRVRNKAEYDVVIRANSARLEPADPDKKPDAILTADQATWKQIGEDVRGGMDAYGKGRLEIRKNLHLGVALLAATSGMTDPGRLEFHRVKTRRCQISYVQAGTGSPVVCLHGLGGTKGSFLPTVAALADEYRVIALDLPGFGDSDKPIAAPYNAAYFANCTAALLDELNIDTAHVIGNSMGGRVALELGLEHSDRVSKLALLAPSLAWLRDRRWAAPLKLIRPELGLLQLAPRPIVEAVVQKMIPNARDGWTAIGVDEFLRAYLTPRGRAAFYAAARNIYLEEPHGENGFWTRLAELQTDSLFVWGRRDNVVPLGFARHVEAALPNAQHVEIDCGHVPQVERPAETHRAVRAFLAAKQVAGQPRHSAATA